MWWWIGRSIPASRSGVRAALETLEITSTKMLLFCCYVLDAEETEEYMDEIRIRAITESVRRRIGYLSQLAISEIPEREHSTEDDVEENIAADYVPKMDL